MATAILSMGLAFALPLNVLAQNQLPANKINISLKTVFKDGKVYLRWAPANFFTWKKGIDLGYTVERREWRKDNFLIPLAEVFNSSKILISKHKPVREEDWEPFAEQNDLAGVAAGMMYGDSLDVLASGNTMMSVINKAKDNENRFGFSLFAADQDPVVAQWMGLTYEDNNLGFTGAERDGTF